RKKNPREHWIPVGVPPIVSHEIWELAQRRKKNNLEQKKSQNKRTYLLSGMVKCGHCGLNCSGKHTAGRYYYFCNIKGNNLLRPRECNLPYFRAEKMEAEIWGWIKSLIMDEVELR